MDDISAIKQVKYRYLRAIDTKNWDLLASTLTEDIIGNYGEDGHQGGNLVLTGRDNLLGFMRDSLGPNIITEHRVDHPEITVAGDEATGSWYMQDRVVMIDLEMMLTGAAFYTDRYRRTADGWKVCETGYDRTYELTISLHDLPSFNLKTGVSLNL
jgi:hypothetical protein